MRRLSMPMIQLLVSLLALWTTVYSQPYEAYPIDKQYPPVARVGEQFEFQISNDTFRSSAGDSSQIAYDAYELPSWLSFDSASRVFSGKADSSALDEDDLYFDFILEGTDASDNESLNKTYQLVLTKRSSIEVADNFNLLALLKNYGSTNGKDGLILTPDEIFNVTFERSTFTSDHSVVAYYGRSQAYNAPLPNWLSFDANNLKFSGTAPVVNSNIAPQVSYGFVLTATDFEGYSGVSVPFNLVIGAHELTTSIQNRLLINVTSSGDFTYQLPLNYVYFDNDPIQSDKLGSIEMVNAPSWVKLDNDTLSGTMPMDSSSENSANFSVAVYDTYDDVIYLNLMIEATSDLFAVTTLPNINATRGEWFQYSFLPSQFTDYSQTNVSVNYSNASQSHDWIHFVSSNMTLHGLVPDDFQSLAMQLVASRDSKSQDLDFQIIGMDSKVNSSNHTNSTTTSSSSLTSTSSATSSTSSSATKITESPSATAAGISPIKKKSNKTTAIACGVAIPLGLIALLGLLLLLFLRRRKNRNANHDNEKSPSISGPDVNNPANKPNQAIVPPVNPFDDDQSSITSSARRLGALNAMRLDEASDSEASTINEKRSSVATDELYQDARSTENLLKKPDTEFFDPQNRSSSVYINSEPANRKSWRYQLSSPTKESVMRDSCISTNTVSTAELLNTEIKDGQNIKKDPRKSTLGIRDSVFLNNNSKSQSSPSMNVRPGTRDSSEGDQLPILDEHSNVSPELKSNTCASSSSSDDFVPVKNGENYDWIHRQKPDRQPSNKRLVQTQNQSKVDIGQAHEVEGHFPEKI